MRNQPSPESHSVLATITWFLVCLTHPSKCRPRISCVINYANRLKIFVLKSCKMPNASYSEKSSNQLPNVTVFNTNDFNG